MNNQGNDIPPWVDDPDDPGIDAADERITSSGAARKVNASDGYNTLEGYIHAKTAKAILFEIHSVNGTPVTGPDDEGDKQWFPLSQTKSVICAAHAQDEYDVIRVSDWIARTKGII